jgi:hypothetical protein
VQNLLNCRDERCEKSWIAEEFEKVAEEGDESHVAILAIKNLINQSFYPGCG